MLCLRCPCVMMAVLAHISFQTCDMSNVQPKATVYCVTIVVSAREQAKNFEIGILSLFCIKWKFLPVVSEVDNSASNLTLEVQAVIK